MKLVCNTWKEHDELGKVYHTTPKKNRRQVFAFFLWFFDNPYEFESKGKSIAQALSVLHWIITNLRAIKKSWGLQLISTVVITQKHNASHTLMRWVIGAGRVNSELQSVRSGSNSGRRGKYELACLQSCMDFEQICCNCWCKQSINRKRYSHNNQPRTFAYKLCHSFFPQLDCWKYQKHIQTSSFWTLNVEEAH